MLWISGLCFGGAALLALLAAAVFVGAARINPAWALIAAGALLAVAGLQTQTMLRLNADVLVQKQSHASLLAAQLEQQRRAVDSLADGLDIAIFICDARGSILYANRRACEFFRFENPLGRSLLAVTLSHDLENLVLQSNRLGETQNAELTFTYPDERVGLAKAWCPDDADSRVFLSIYEITDLRRLERIRQDFVANVSHELRTPMTLIRAMAETLLDEADPEDALSQKYLSKITTEVDRLSMISQDLLVLSTAESNPVRKQQTDLADVFRTAVHNLEAKARDKGLSLSYGGPDHQLVEANTSQMTQVAFNLIDNAINYTAQGMIHVELTREGGDVEVAVTDTGMGIAVEHQKRIFERFYRVDKARSRSTGGTGLGLSIVKHIVEAHAGTLSVRSELNVGSTFTVRLPIGSVPDLE